MTRILTENPAFFGIYILPKGGHIWEAEPERVHRNWGKLKSSVRQVYKDLKKDKFTGRLIVKTTHGHGKRNTIEFVNGKPKLIEAAWDSLIPDDRALKKADDIKKQAKAAGNLKKGDVVNFYAKSAGWGALRLLKPDGSQGGTLRTGDVLYVGRGNGRVKVSVHPLRAGAKHKQYNLLASQLVRAGTGRGGWAPVPGRAAIMRLPRDADSQYRRQGRPKRRRRSATPLTPLTPPPRRTSRKKVAKGRGKWAGKNVVVTGAMKAKRPELEKILRSKGANPQGSVQLTTDMLIVGYKPGRAKLDRAAELGVPIVLSETLTRSLGTVFGPKEPGAAPAPRKKAPAKKAAPKKKRTSKAPAKKRTSKRAAPRRATAPKPTRKTSRKKAPAKKRTSKKKVAAKPTKKFFWQDAKGNYGMIAAASSADAKRRLTARGKRGVKVKNRAPAWY